MHESPFQDSVSYVASGCCVLVQETHHHRREFYWTALLSPSHGQGSLARSEKGTRHAFT